MPREVRDAEGTGWSCIQAYAGLSSEPEKELAAQVEGEPDRVRVVCTPSGGAQSVALHLPTEWESALPDEALLHEIERARQA